MVAYEDQPFYLHTVIQRSCNNAQKGSKRTRVFSFFVFLLLLLFLCFTCNMERTHLPDHLITYGMKDKPTRMTFE